MPASSDQHATDYAFFPVSPSSSPSSPFPHLVGLESFISGMTIRQQSIPTSSPSSPETKLAPTLVPSEPMSPFSLSFFSPLPTSPTSSTSSLPSSPPHSPEDRQCIQWVREGNCPRWDRGYVCEYAHPLMVDRPCKYFMRGYCGGVLENGAQCAYSHDAYWLTAPESLHECRFCHKFFTADNTQRRQHFRGKEHKRAMEIHKLNATAKRNKV